MKPESSPVLIKLVDVSLGRCGENCNSVSGWPPSASGEGYFQAMPLSR